VISQDFETIKMSATQLTGLILPRGMCPTIGREIGRNAQDGVALFFQSIRTFNRNASHPKGGSYRFVRVVDGEIVAGLQVMSRTGKDGTVANVYCHPEWRRRGLATELLDAARNTFESLEFSTDRSNDGEAWVAHHESGATPHGIAPR
jgi:ribosomal protein S18 acetylase RimI-like enzyme